MRFGINLHNYGPLGHRAEMLEVVDAADELGFDSLWVSDHILMPKVLSEPYGSIVESMSTLAFIAGRTRRLHLGASVVVLPQRDPILLAKQAAAIHELSEGRFTLGVGVGWAKQEFEMLGASWEQRGQIADEFIEVMQELWTSDDPRFHGEHVHFEDALFAPRPRGGLPLVIGGVSDAALRRAARYGAGWHAIHSDVGAIREARSRLERLAGARHVEIQLRIHVRMNDAAPPPNHHLAGDVDAVRSAIAEYDHAGVDHLIVDFGLQPSSAFLSQMRTFATEVAMMGQAVEADVR